MGGTLLNIITVAIGGTLGLLVGNRLSARIQESVVTGIGLITLFVGMSNAWKTGNAIIPLLSIVLGVMLGEWLRIDLRLEQFAGWLQRRYAGSSPEATPSDTSTDSDPGGLNPRERFITGFVTASLVFCVGPLTFMGAIQDGMGLRVGFDLLAIKSVLDMFAGMAFAASFGVGVLFSIITILLYQGGLALLGVLIIEAFSDPTLVETLDQSPAILEMTATGGIILLGLALVLLDIKKPRVANFLPALLVAPALVGIADVLGINIYPL